MQTPSFYDNRHQIKAKPITQNHGQEATQSKNKVSSMFSPIPCKPQSECSIFGVRGDHNTPYTPFGRQDVFNPKLSPMCPPQSASVLKPHAQNSKNSTKQRITPGQFLRQATPLQGGASLASDTPRHGNEGNVYNLFSGPAMSLRSNRQTPLQTPTQPLQQARANSNSSRGFATANTAHDIDTRSKAMNGN